MTERSYFWDGTTVGDAVLAPYSADDEFATALRAAGYTSEITNRGGILLTLNNLAVTGAVSPIQVDTGQAWVQGHFYWNDAAATVVIPNSIASRYDRIVLQKDFAAKTVRIYRHAGVEGGGVPALTQVWNVIWEVPLATLHVVVGAITIVDDREFVPNRIYVAGRQGGDPADWSISGNNNYFPYNGNIYLQVGSKFVNPAGGTVVTYPTAFSQPPLVVVTAETPGDFASAVSSSATQATLRVWRLSTGLETIGFVTWYAIGPR